MWQVVNGPKLSCWRITLRVARSRLKATPGEPPLVRFLGRKKPYPNMDQQNLDWYLRKNEHGQEIFDFGIDPSWGGHPHGP